MSHAEPDDRRSLPADLETLPELYALLASCLSRPDRELREAIETGDLEAELTRLTSSLSLEVGSPPSFADGDDAREAYRRTFDAYDGPSAPPVESVYEPWHDGTNRELLSGPAAVDMRRRYAALGVDIPGDYQPDHVALLLEYASLVLEAGEVGRYDQFHEEHFDWIPAFRTRIEETDGDPFYRWTVATLESVLEAVDTHRRSDR